MDSTACIAPYSAFEHWLSNFPHRLDPPMAMWSVFLDDSGTHSQSEIAVAACFLSDKRRWKAFDEEWSAAAHDPNDGFDVFHMTDFNSGGKKFWNWDADKKNRVFGKISNIVRRHALVGFISSVVKSDYDEFVTGRLREKIGEHHYTFALESCMVFIQQWFKQDMRQMPEPIHYFFDRMGKGKHEIDNLMDDVIPYGLADHFGLEVGGWSYENKAVFLPLQSADILAWEGYHYMTDVVLPCVQAGTERSAFKTRLDPGGNELDIRGRFFDRNKLPGIVAHMTAQYARFGWDSPRRAFFAD